MSTAINVNGNIADSAADQAPNAQQSNFILIKGRQVLTNADKHVLEEHHVKIQEYVSDSTYLCQYTPTDLQVLRNLPFVQTCDVYAPDLKTTASLKQLIEEDKKQSQYEIDVILHSAAQSPEQFASTLAQRTGVAEDAMEICEDKIRLTVDQARIPIIAKLDDVNRIEEVRLNNLFNDFARRVLHDGFTDTSAKGLSPSSKYQGQGQIIAVADTGIDPNHTAFKGRLKQALPLWRKKMSDSNGHGTHVCGSVLGDGTSKDEKGNEVKIQGTAPQAELIMQSLWFYYSHLPEPKWGLRTHADLKNLFRGPFQTGARVHSNSWGPGWDDRFGQLGYEQQATQIDTFINTNQDFVILVAAGNDYKVGRGQSQIGANSAAKNCITVGATMTARPNNGYAYTPQDVKAADTAALAPFSSRGPTRATTDATGNPVIGRIKPDVMAPGTSILSAGSANMNSDDRELNGWSYGPWEDDRWIFMSGTSMATPLVAGCVAVLRQALIASGIKRPSAALIKAILINGTVDIQGSHGGVVIPPAPNGLQGFGRVDLDNSLAMIDQGPKDSGFVDGSDADANATTKSLGPGGSWKSSSISSTGSGKIFKATLAYPDPPGELLQNKLNLIVKATDGTERHGNMGTSQAFDKVNNVEKVVWENIPAGNVSIEVRVAGLTVPDARQSFAVAWTLQ